MSLLNAFKRVKNAVAPMGIQSHILVKDGWMYASNLTFTIATPTVMVDAFLSPAADFARALTVVGDTEDKIKVLKHKVVVSRADAKAELSLLNPSEFRYQGKEGEFTEIDDQEAFAVGLSRTLPFVSDDKTKPWACSVRLLNGAAYATNNISVVRAEVGSVPDVMLPDYLVKYIVEEPTFATHIAINTTSAIVVFDDGTWARATLPAQKMPDAVVSMSDAVEPPDFELSDDWKRAYYDAVAMAEDMLVIAPDAIKSARGHGRFEAAVKSPVEKETYWNPKFLTKVINVADRLDPSQWPSPAPFTGPGVQGVVIGRSD